MQIGIFTDDFLPRKSGVVTSTLALKDGLTALGHTVYIFAPNVRGYHDEDPNVVRLPSLNPRVYDTGRMALPYPGLMRKFKKYELNIVHTQTEMSVGLLGDAVAEKYRLPHVATAHTLWAEALRYQPFQILAACGLFAVIYQLYFQKRLPLAIPQVDSSERLITRSLKTQIWHMQTLFLNHCDAVITPSGHFLEGLQKHRLKTPAHIIPNGVDTRIFARAAEQRNYQKDKLRLVCVARLSPEKRVDVLLRALAAAHNPQVTLTVVGSGPNEWDYRELSSSLGLDNQVTFTGSIDTQAITDIMQNSDVLVLPSYKFDNQPMVILEAISAGLPVLYCDPALKAGLTPDNAYLTANEKAPAITKAINELYKSGEKKLQAMSKASLALSKTYDVKNFARSIEQIYRKLLEV